MRWRLTACLPTRKHIAARCGTPEPPKVKGKTGFKGDGKGKGKGEGKVDWNVFKRDHGSTDCRTKQHDAGGEGGKGAGLASVEDGFDITALDKDEENEWQEVFPWTLTYEQFTVTDIRPDPRGWEWTE